MRRCSNWRRWMAVAAAVCLCAVAGPPAGASQKLMVELQDGSRVVGETDLPTLTLTNEVVGLMNVPLAKINFVQLTGSNGVGRVVLSNGDQLQGILRAPALKLQTAFGPVTLAFNLIRQLRVASAAGNLRMADGLVLYFSFDADDGETVKDLSGHSNDGQVIGSPQSVAGVSGAAYRFGGQRDCIRVRSSESLRSKTFTASAWVKPGPRRSPTDEGVLGNHQAGANVNSYLVRRRNGQLNAWFVGNGAADDVFAGPNNGVALADRWGLVTLVHDGTNALFYVNGALTGKHPIEGYRGGEYDFLIGAQEWDYAGKSPQRFWNGLIDEVRIYNRALSADEVRELYDAIPDHGAVPNPADQ